MAKFRSQVVLYAVLVMLLSGCLKGSSHPFLMVQSCLNDDEGVEMFIEELRSIAAAENMRFSDGSDQAAQTNERAEQLLREHGQPTDLGNRTGPTFLVGLLSSDMTVMAGDLGSGYEVLLGFNGRGGTDEDFAFAQKVMERLEGHWRFEEVPQGMGAFPKGDCP